MEHDPAERPLIQAPSVPPASGRLPS
jgi:hypothetical protein